MRSYGVWGKQADLIVEHLSAQEKGEQLSSSGTGASKIQAEILPIDAHVAVVKDRKGLYCIPSTVNQIP